MLCLSIPIAIHTYKRHLPQKKQPWTHPIRGNSLCIKRFHSTNVLKVLIDKQRGHSDQQSTSSTKSHLSNSLQQARTQPSEALYWELEQ